MADHAVDAERVALARQWGESGPPCRACEHWSPQFLHWYDESLRAHFDGYRLCYSARMQPDFSCFRERRRAAG